MKNKKKYKNNQMAINPQVITYGRKMLNLSSKDLKQEFPKSDLWESGKDLPTYDELKKLSSFLDITTAVFFFPKPPLDKRDYYLSTFNDEFKNKQLPLLNHKQIKNIKKIYILSDNMDSMLVKGFVDFHLNKDNIGVVSNNIINKLIKNKKTFNTLNGLLQTIENDLGVFVFRKNMSDIISINFYDYHHPIIYISSNKHLFEKTKNMFYNIFVEIIYCLGNLYQKKSNIRIKNKKYYSEALTEVFVKNIVKDIQGLPVIKNSDNGKDIISKRYKEIYNNFQDENISKENFDDF